MPNEGTKAVDYATIFPNTLENGKLIPIRGKPTFKTLTDTRKLLIQNAATIHTTLGGGQHGYSGLVLPPTEYALISNVPFLMPPLPPQDPQYPQGATQHQITATDRVHTDQWRRYNEAVAVEQALKKQLIEVVDRIYVEQRLNNVTGILTGPLHATITWLLTTYGRVNYSEVIDEQAVLAKYLVQVHTTLTDFFNKIDKHLPHATATGVPLDVISLAKQSIQKNADFRLAVLAWNARNQQPTWISFKQFFLTQQAELESVLEDTSAGQMFHAPEQSEHAMMMQLMNMLLENQQDSQSPAPAPPAPAPPAPAPAAPAPAPAPPAPDQ